MKRILMSLLLLSSIAHADTMDHYMNIANNIPQMEMKADPQSQAWARSARNVLLLTSDSIAETLALANESASARGEPLFCLPPGTKLSPEQLNDIIQDTYRTLPGVPAEKDKMTVSQMALAGLTKKYPCTKQQNQAAQYPFKMGNQQTAQNNSNPFFNPPPAMQHQGS